MIGQHGNFNDVGTLKPRQMPFFRWIPSQAFRGMNYEVGKLDIDTSSALARDRRRDGQLSNGLPCAPPAVRLCSPLEVCGILKVPHRIGRPPIAHMHASLGSPVMAYKSKEIAFNHAERGEAWPLSFWMATCPADTKPPSPKPFLNGTKRALANVTRSPLMWLSEPYSIGASTWNKKPRERPFGNDMANGLPGVMLQHYTLRSMAT